MPDPTLPDQVPWDDLARFFAGELPPSDVAALERWIAEAPDRPELVRQLGLMCHDAGELGEAWEVESALQRIKRPAAGPARVIRLPAFYREAPDTSRTRWRRGAMRAAAVIAVLGGAGWLATTRLGPVPAVAISEASTPPGQRALLGLPDGTQVTLGPSSHLRYAIAPDRGARTVFLDGDAYFIVTHDARRPFTVQTAHGTATDLGTRFSVRAHAADSVVDVVVAEGRVALHAKGADSVVLDRGDRGSLSVTGATSVERGINVAPYLAWTEGRLQFRDTPLRDVAVQVGRWYGLDLRLADARLGERRVTASFKDESVPEVLRLLSESLELTAERRGDVVTLRTR